jgi:hypothetical protein
VGVLRLNACNVQTPAMPLSPGRYYLELSTKQRKEWEQRLEEVKKSSDQDVRAQRHDLDVLFTH